MRRSNILLSVIALGFLATFTSHVEGQLFRRGNCCGQTLRAPVIRVFQPRIMNYTGSMNSCCSSGTPVIMSPQVMSFQPATNNCGCAGGTVMNGSVANGGVMIGNVMNNMSGNIVNAPTTGSVLNQNISGGLIVETVNESCQTTFTSCNNQCAVKFPGPENAANRLLCEKHCSCNLQKCNACNTNRVVTCNDGPAPGQDPQPNPCAPSAGPNTQ